MNPADGPFSDLQKASIALGRYGSREEIAAGVVFLPSPAASYVTGTVLNVDGGYGA
jgi:3-oxoacyl-[acyl-carrier protein] reductase